MKKILVTGAAGFIGFSFIKRIINNFFIVGIDNLNSYYNVNLKIDRLKELGIKKTNDKFETNNKNLKFIRLDLNDEKSLKNLFQQHNFDYIVHLAAQAGVRYSIENPKAYIESNILGTFNILENIKNSDIKHVIIAGSSSVYGKNKIQPFSEDHPVNNPVSLYAASKISTEAIAHSYSEIYDIKTTVLRFFTVYGPWGRPDMAYFSFTNNILNNKPINVFNKGNLARDFTFIDDIIQGISLVFNKYQKMDEKYNLFNIGSGRKICLINFIEILEQVIGKKAIKKFVEMQDGDVNETFADISKLQKTFGYKPKTSFKHGIEMFYDWYKNYYQ